MPHALGQLGVRVDGGDARGEGLELRVIGPARRGRRREAGRRRLGVELLLVVQSRSRLERIADEFPFRASFCSGWM